MVVRFRGIIRGKHIELEQETGLAAGSSVAGSLESFSPSTSEKNRLIDSLCGAWANDESIERVFAEIERQRAEIGPRDINLDAPS